MALRDQIVFLRQAIVEASQTGAFSATSRVVAEAIADGLPPRGEPRRVLEVGAGTGAITRSLVPRLGSEDQLDLCELNPTFVAHLRQRFGQVPGGPQVRVIGEDVLRLDDDEPYSAVISSLPLLNMEPQDVKRVFEGLLARLSPGAPLVYYDYWAKGIRGYLPSRERARVREVLRVTRGFLDQHERRRRVVLRNVPPACVHYLTR